MLRATLFAIIMLFSNHASAQDCPEFYRFVDFGLEGNDGRMYRGGTTFRAEDFDGRLLLLTERTVCRAVREVSKDGHGNPIPVVTSVHYNPAMMDVSLNGLNVSLVDDAEMTARESANTHQIRLKHSDAKLTQGTDFLCVSLRGKPDLSCQLVSPYPGNVPLFVYCDILKCTMPVLAINKRLQASAAWSSDEIRLENTGSAGKKVVDKVRAIHDFLKPLSAAL